MNVKIVASAFIVTVGLYGPALAIAEPFSERGTDWITASPPPDPAVRPQSLRVAPDGSFASSWGNGRTPTQAEGSYPSNSMSRKTSCDIAPRVAFSERNDFPSC